MKTTILTSLVIILGSILLTGFIKTNHVCAEIETKRINIDGKDFVVCVSSRGVAICPY